MAHGDHEATRGIGVDLMPGKGQFKRVYGIYDKDDNLLFVGNIQECTEFTGKTRAELNCIRMRMEKGAKPRKYGVVRIE